MSKSAKAMRETRQACFYCLEWITDMIYVDHVLPESRGGSGHPDNLVPACEGCNCSKGAKTPSEWRTDLPPQAYEQELKSRAFHTDFKPLAFVPRRAGDPMIQLAVHMHESERSALRKLASRRGIPMSDVVRALILKELIEAIE